MKFNIKNRIETTLWIGTALLAAAALAQQPGQPDRRVRRQDQQPSEQQKPGQPAPVNQQSGQNRQQPGQNQQKSSDQQQPARQSARDHRDQDQQPAPDRQQASQPPSGGQKGGDTPPTGQPPSGGHQGGQGQQPPDDTRGGEGRWQPPHQQPGQREKDEHVWKQDDRGWQREMDRESWRMQKYHSWLDRRQDDAEKRHRFLEQQKRAAHARFHHDYMEHLREQQLRFRDWRRWDFRNDPYFYASPIYRYYRGDRYYEINRYVADVLQRAVQYGYEEGYLAGRADWKDGWSYDNEGCYAYEDATYGYPGYYVDLGEYRHYFREGFRRGYDDGYYGSSNYGRFEDGKYIMLASILARILYLIPLN